MADIEEMDDPTITVAAPSIVQEESKPKKPKGGSAKQTEADKPPTSEPSPKNPVGAPPPDVTPHPVMAVFTVERTITVAWRSQLIRLRAGSEVSEGSYGPGCVAAFRSAGVSLIPK